MADVETVARTAPLGSGTVAVSPIQPRTRLVFRGDTAAAEACGRAFGPVLSRDVCRATEDGARAALWLGPDEWLLLAAEGDGPTLFKAIEASVGCPVPHALVDVSHRQVGFDVTLSGAARRGQPTSSTADVRSTSRSRPFRSGCARERCWPRPT